MRKSVPLLLLSLSLPVSAQVPYLVKDINTTYSNNTKSSSPTAFAAYRNRIFFTATTDDAGTELWSTDGTSSGTAMVADIIPGSGSSNPMELAVINDVLLFTARDVNHGIELWTTDGTAAGTHQFMDINPGPSSSQPFGKTLYKNRMLFSADDGTNGREPWITDGTVAGTHMLKDINPGSGSSFPSYYRVFGDSVYFAAYGGLWKTDGTESGTVKVATVGAVRNLAVAGSQLFFEGLNADTGWELWASDGTEAGTRMVTEILPGQNGAFDSNYYFQGFTPLGNRVLFLANDGIHGREMWISDGTAAGTRMVRDFVPGAKGMWDYGYASITAFNGRAYFSATDAEHGMEMWVTDGTDSGTGLFADLNPGPAHSYPGGFVVSGGRLFFTALPDNNAFFGTRLWVTDGTAGGTRVINGQGGVGFGFTAGGLWAVDGKVYFAGTTAINGGEPWVTDGTDAGSRMIANIAPDGAPSSGPRMFAAAGDLLFFYAVEGLLEASNVANPSLWRSDGTATGTFKLRESGQHPDMLVAAGPLVFFFDQINSPQLMVSDGTVAGTKPAADFMSRFGAHPFGGFFPFGDTLFAAVEDLGIYRQSLWKTTAAQNAPAVQLGGLNPFGLIEVSGHYLFYGEGPRGPYDYGLWATDGTRAGTYAIVPDLGDTVTQKPSALVNAAGTVFFLKTLRDEKTKLWKSDGTTDGTTLVKELPGTDSYQEIRAAGRRVFFVIGGSLWSSDGTEPGTVELMKVTFPFSYEHNDLKPIGNGIVFAPLDQTKGFELWTSDGTPAGTKLLKSLGHTFPQLTSIDGLAYFAGADNDHGTELWTTDGTAEGTKLLADVNPGVASSYPSNFTKVGNLLYFSAYTDATGNELWALPLTDPRLSINDSRVAEGDTGTTPMHFTVSLTPPAKQTVTVDYATSDGTAHAGDDYDATSGTLTFAPGETTKTIDVNVRGDVVPENNETLFVTLRNASGARLVKGEGAGIIDDDDQTADLTITPRLSDGFSGIDDSVNVTNSGPRTATDVVVKTTSTPSYSGSRCTTCLVPQLAAGASVNTAYDSVGPFQQAYLSATATARQRDPQPSNNSAAWTLNANRTLAMNVPYLITGATATITARTSTPAVITSSDPSVVSVPADMTKLNDHFGTFTVTALKPGVSSVNVNGLQFPLLVTVVAPGTAPRWPGALSMGTDFSATRFDKQINVIVEHSGTALFSGATATGTVVVTVTGQEVARRSVDGSGTIKIPLYLPAMGANVLTVAYSGDANFLPQTVSPSVYANQGLTTLSAVLQRVPGAAGTFSLTVRATGSPVAAPTGMLSILNGGTEIAKVPLVASGDGTSVALTTLTNLPASPTLTINYPGDARYYSSTQQVRLPESHRRAAGH